MGEILSYFPTYFMCVNTSYDSLAQMTTRFYYKYKSGTVTAQIIKSAQSLPFPVTRNKDADNLVLNFMFSTKLDIFEKYESVILNEVSIKQYGLLGY